MKAHTLEVQTAIDDAVTQKRPAVLGQFIILTVAFSAVFWTIRIATKTSSSYYTAGLMWSPALAAILVLWRQGAGLASLGLASFGGRYAAIGYSIPIAYASLAYIGIWLAGLGSFPNVSAIADIENQLGWHLGPAVFVPLYAFLVATTGLVSALARALGEEIGWRGFLVPHLATHVGFTEVAIISGIIWALWHVPLIALASYHSAAPRWFAMGCFVIMVIGMSVILAWLRLRSNSVWPCALLHACHNVMIQSFFTPLTTDRGTVTAFAVDEFGFALPTAVLLFAFIAWRSVRPPVPRYRRGRAAARPRARNIV